MGRLTTRREVYNAALELTSMAEGMPGTTALKLAGEEADDCQARGDSNRARFWSEVHTFLIMNDFLDGIPEFVEEKKEALR